MSTSDSPGNLDDFRDALENGFAVLRDLGCAEKQGTFAIVAESEPGKEIEPIIAWSPRDEDLMVVVHFWWSEQDKLWNCLIEEGEGRIEYGAWKRDAA